MYRVEVWQPTRQVQILGQGGNIILNIFMNEYIYKQINIHVGKLLIKYRYIDLMNLSSLLIMYDIQHISELTSQVNEEIT